MSITVHEVYTTVKNYWQENKKATLNSVDSKCFAEVKIDTKKTMQTIDGFGASFCQLGWDCMTKLDEKNRNEVLDIFFKPGEGLNFNICRTPIASNDMSFKYYSYNDTKDDFAMKNFSIDYDKETLIPFIKEGLKRNPQLKVWASPWCPPVWMKKNEHYACVRPFKNDFLEMPENNLPEGKEIKEGTDAFKVEDKYLDAYALYFGKYIDAYKEQGVNIFMIMPQNEFNSAQWFPSCTWTTGSISKFVGKLAPEMKKRNVEIYFGTMERPNPELITQIVENPLCKDVIKGVGFQWAGKYAIPTIRKKYPHLKLYQTEMECHFGDNDWLDAFYTWHAITHYFKNGVSAFIYWDFVLQVGGGSSWAWPQNSLVTVDPKTGKWWFNPEYYVMRHLSQFVKPGAKFLDIETASDVIAFLNPDNNVVLIVCNESRVPLGFCFQINGKNFSTQLRPKGITTLVIPPL